MKPHPPTRLSRLAITTGIILSLAACSSPRGAPDALTASSTRHPDLNVQPGKVSSSRLISDAELRGGKSERRKRERLSVGKTLESALIVTGAVTIMTLAFVGSAYVGAPPPEMHWPTNLPGISDQPTLKSRIVSASTHCQIKLTGSDIRYVPSRNGKDVEIARARGEARIDVSDRFGTYYCRADEIHYRAASNEIILRGRASVSSVYAPDIHDFGLTRVDLVHNVVEYSSRGPQKPRPGQRVEGLAAVNSPSPR